MSGCRGPAAVDAARFGHRRAVAFGLATLLGLVLAASGAAAQVPEDYRAVRDRAASAWEGCLLRGTDRAGQQGCAWEAMDLCLAEGPSGDTTAGLAICAGAVDGIVDAKLNALWPLLRGRGGADGGAPLLQAQRAWLAWRDAECALATARVAGGSMAAYAGGFCRIELTGARVARFLEWLRY